MDEGILQLALKIPVRGDGLKIAVASALALALITPFTTETFLVFSVALSALAASSAILADARLYAQLVLALILCGFRRDRSWIVLLVNSLFLSAITSVAGAAWVARDPLLALLYFLPSIALSLLVGIIELKDAIVGGEAYGQ